MWRREPAPAHTTGCRTSVRSTRTGDALGSGKARRRPARTRSPRPLPRGFAMAARRAPASRRPSRCRPAGRPGRARRAGDPSQTKTSDFTIWPSVQPTASAAASAVGVSVAELLDPRFGAGRAEKRRDALDRLRPDCGHDLTELHEAHVIEARGVERLDELVRRGRVDREHHQRLAALLRPRDGHVRDVHARLAEHRPDPADHPGLVLVADEHHVRADLEVDPEAERAAEEQPRLGADRRPGDGRAPRRPRRSSPRPCSCSRGTRGSAPRRPRSHARPR